MAPSRRTKKKTTATGGSSGGGGGVSAAVSAAVSTGTGASSTAAGTAVPMEGAEEAHVTATADGQREDDDNDRAEEKCPACKDGAMTELAGDKETWIQCDACKTWFHWNCAGNGGDAQQVDKWSVPPLPRPSLHFFFGFLFRLEHQNTIHLYMYPILFF